MHNIYLSRVINKIKNYVKNVNKTNVQRFQMKLNVNKILTKNAKIN